MQPRSVASLFTRNVLVSLLLVMTGLAGGAVAGVVASAPGSISPEATNRIAAFEPVQFTSGGLTVEEGPVAAPAVVRTVRRVITETAGSAQSSVVKKAAANSVMSGLSIPGAVNGSGAQTDCDRLDDAKIHWLLNLVEKTRQANPDQAAVADRVEQQLRSQLGRNMCAEDAQVQISNLCADRAVRNFMNLMVKQLPFFVRPLVGDPCTQDLVKAADKWL